MTQLSLSDSVERARRHGLGDLVRRTALRFPDKTAVVDGDVRMTYAEFDATINRTANALAERGVRKGDRIALLSHNSWHLDRKSTRLNSSHANISYAVFCLKKKNPYRHHLQS